MANLQRFTAQESANVETGALWEPQADKVVTDTWSDDSATNAYHCIDVTQYHTIIITGIATNAVIIDFQGVKATPRDNSLQLEPNDEFTVKIPHGVGNPIYLNMKATASNSTVKMILT